MKNGYKTSVLQFLAILLAVLGTAQDAHSAGFLSHLCQIFGRSCRPNTSLATTSRSSNESPTNIPRPDSSASQSSESSSSYSSSSSTSTTFPSVSAPVQTEIKEDRSDSLSKTPSEAPKRKKRKRLSANQETVIESKVDYNSIIPHAKRRALSESLQVDSDTLNNWLNKQQLRHAQQEIRNVVQRTMEDQVGSLSAQDLRSFSPEQRDECLSKNLHGLDLIAEIAERALVPQDE